MRRHRTQLSRDGSPSTHVEGDCGHGDLGGSFGQPDVADRGQLHAVFDYCLKTTKYRVL